MQTVVVMYKLKRGADIEAYKHWWRTVDRPRHLALGCLNYDICQVDKIEGAPSPYYDIVEVVDIEDIEEWDRQAGSDIRQQIDKEWLQFGDLSTVVKIYCKRVEPVANVEE